MFISNFLSSGPAQVDSYTGYYTGGSSIGTIVEYGLSGSGFVPGTANLPGSSNSQIMYVSLAGLTWNNLLPSTSYKFVMRNVCLGPGGIFIYSSNTPVITIKTANCYGYSVHFKCLFSHFIFDPNFGDNYR
ncbi:MAG: hypothetical protein IPI23_11900 [Bacteroidetes bacterium]|nr:hypothetical protein [Bacteroidota bacterium]